MPWKVYQENGQYCVYKLNPDKSKGAKVKGGCHDNEADAVRHARALYKNVPEHMGMTLDEIEELTELEMIADLAVTKSESWGNEPSSSYLVVGDPQKPTTWHLPYKKHGKIDRGLCGAAYAALTKTHRGQAYGGPDKSAALSKLRGIYKSQGWPLPGAKQMSDAFYTELSLSTMSKPFDGMAVGDFKTAQGSVSIQSEELDAYIANTREVLESTKTESGEIVGLPIDMDAHDHKGGAGWIVDVQRDGDLLRFIPKWTEAGQKLIREGVRRFFSPSFDPEQKVIIGGSMTNYPASRDSKRRIKLRPVELSESLYVSEDEGFDFQGMVDEIVNRLSSFGKAKPTNENFSQGGTMTTPNLAELAAKADTPEGLAELNAYINNQAKTRVTELLEAEQRQQHVTELAETLVGGTKESPRGLQVDKDKLVEFMTSLSPEQAKAAEALFVSIQSKGLIDFEEQGHSKELEGKAKLPDWAAPLLKQAIDDGVTKEEWFAANEPELGEMKSYDLSEYIKKEGE